MAFAESVSWFLRQGLTYKRLTSNSSQSLCGVKVLVLLPQLAKNWGYRCAPLFLASLAIFRAQQGLVCTAPMPCAPHLGFLICSIVLTSGDDWPRHRSPLNQASHYTPAFLLHASLLLLLGIGSQELLWNSSPDPELW